MRHRYEDNSTVKGMVFFMLRTHSGENVFHGYSLENQWEHIIRCEKSLVSPKYRISRSCNMFGNKYQRAQAEYRRASSLKEAWKVFYRMLRTQKEKPA